MPTSLHPSTAAAVEAIYVNHHAWLINWLRRRLGSSCQVADLAHDTFLRLMTSRDVATLREPQAFLRTLAHGVVVNHWRRVDIERAWAEVVAEQPEPITPSPEARAMALETLCRIDAMLGQLNPKARSAFLLSQLDGLGYREIGEQLGISERMVKKYMSQAMLQCLVLASE